MAWNEPGNGDKDRDPWGGSNKHQGPPDLDDVLRKLSRRLRGLLGGRSSDPFGGGGISSIGILLVLGLLFVIWVISGFYTIREAERGVVLRFGKYHETVEPGLRWAPTFIDKVTPVDIESVRSLPASGFMLTQDENVVRVEMDVQYRVVEPRKYLYSVTNPDNSLSQATDSALRFVVGHSTMDDILTTGREVVRQQTWDMIEQITASYNLGLQVIDVNFLPARPPEEVKDAFDDAIAAQEDEERFIREAEAYAREIEPRARGQVRRMEQDAEAYRQRVILEAQGEISRYEQLLPQYQSAPDVTRERLYLETMSKVLGSTSKVLLDTEGNGNLLYLPLDQLRKSLQPDSNSSRSSTLLLPETGDTQKEAEQRSRSSREDRFSQGRN